MENPKLNGYSFSWTQPYTNWQPYQFQDFSKQEQKDFNDVKRVVDAKACEAELRIVEMVDRWVDAMLTYPDAEVIMNKIRQQRSEK